MGRFAVELEVSNYKDLVKVEEGSLEATDVRRKIIRGVVDPGATLLVLPLALANELGLPIMKQRIKLRYADGRRSIRQEAHAVYVRLEGREGIFTAIVEPKRDTVLIGAIVLEQFDLLVDCRKGRVLPRDPDFVLAEIE